MLIQTTPIQHNPFAKSLKPPIYPLAPPGDRRGGLAKPNASESCWNPASSLAGFEVIRHSPKNNATKRCVVFLWAPGKESERIKHVINRTVFSASADVWQREAVGENSRAVVTSVWEPRGGLGFSLEQRRGEEVQISCFFFLMEG